MSARLEKIQLGRSGVWQLERKTITKKEADFAQLRSAINGHGRYTPEGTYVGLRRGETLVMSNTPDELRDLWPLRKMASGHVLIAGLGLGCAVDAALEKSNVESVTVVEKSLDVIALVGPSFQDKRVFILLADIFTWCPPKHMHYQAAWFDIWDNICSDNLMEMARLHRRFARCTSWRGSWCKEQCRRQR